MSPPHPTPPTHPPTHPTYPPCPPSPPPPPPVQDNLHDSVLASQDEGGSVSYYREPMYHLHAVHPEGSLIYTIFGKESVDKLCMMRYEPTVHHLHNGSAGILGDNAWVFVARKPAAATGAAGVAAGAGAAAAAGGAEDGSGAAAAGAAAAAASKQ